MAFLDTTHKRKSALFTGLITVLLLLVIFFFGLKYMDPPIEYGIAVNFGTTDFGSGDQQPQEELQPMTQPSEPIEEQQEEIEEVVEETSSEAVKAEEVITQENEEAIAIKKEEEAKKKLEADRRNKLEKERLAKEKIEKEKREEAERVKREQEEKKRKLDALIGGVSKSEVTTTGGEGNDNKAGDKGQLDGDPYAPSYFGSGGYGSGGVGYGLNGRGRATYSELKQDCNEYGLVIVRIVVNR
ncbi:MAG: energy transducer TonB, partial [Lutimonas sp.]